MGFVILTSAACGGSTASESVANPAPTTTAAEVAPKAAPTPETTTTAMVPTKTASSETTTAPASTAQRSNVPAGCGKVWESTVGSGNPAEWDEAGPFEPGFESWVGLWTDGQPGKCDYALAFVQINRQMHVWFSPCEGMFTSLTSPALSKNGFGVEGNLGGSAGRVALQIAAAGPDKAQGTLAVMLPAGAEMGSGEKKITFTRACH